MASLFDATQRALAGTPEGDLMGFLEGMPYVGRGGIPHMDAQHRERLAERSRFQSRTFRLWDDGDVAAYHEVMDLIANGRASRWARREIEAPPDPACPADGPRLKVYLEWTFSYYTEPERLDHRDR